MVPASFIPQSPPAHWASESQSSPAVSSGTQAPLSSQNVPAPQPQSVQSIGSAAHGPASIGPMSQGITVSPAPSSSPQPKPTAMNANKVEVSANDFIHGRYAPIRTSTIFTDLFGISETVGAALEESTDDRDGSMRSGGAGPGVDEPRRRSATERPGQGGASTPSRFARVDFGAPLNSMVFSTGVKCAF